jgi:hypothetical protein
VSVGFRLIDSKGQVVKNELRALEAQSSAGPLAFRAEVALPAGLYTLRLAALDGRERHGSVEHPVKAAPISAGPLALSDLMLVPGEPGDGAGPSVELECTGGAFGALVELEAERADAWREADVTFEVAASETGPPLATAGARWQEGAAGRRMASARLAGDGLRPGDYWVRAVVSLGGKAVAQAARPFRRL